jgi:uncharacterized protein YrrD
VQKGKSVTGRDVLSLATGARIHSVKEILIDRDNEKVVALLVDEGGLLGTSTVVPFGAITSFGRDAVIINEETSVVAASSDPQVKVILEDNHKLLGKTVFTEDGQKVGSIGDLYFDDQSGRITGFEITGGLLGDIARGTSFLGADEVRLAGQGQERSRVDDTAVVARGCPGRTAIGHRRSRRARKHRSGDGPANHCRSRRASKGDQQSRASLRGRRRRRCE